ncbi:unnamed protein product [Nyctereutes procyonoides]|uniref:(raccoon dog) hypothetical protein n=1 Tax=Nyctereutes procyonoides TaxID=34880 RepID=A0A811ZQX0_NYCPR|nr:unnamed protein product [Nyctereutes procyonoides]
MLMKQPVQEVELRSMSATQLRVVQTKYVEDQDSLLTPNKSNEVPGKLYNVEHVLINVGTGYYVEKIAEDAKGFLKKTDFLPKQMEKTQPALQEKHAIKQAVTEMMS